MEDGVINHQLSQLDYSKVASLQQKRTLAFVNHFTLTTVHFLNNFVNRCEDKLQKFERKLQKVEASLIILETKLSSVPELDTAQGKVDPPSHTNQPDNSSVDETVLTVNTEETAPPTEDKPDQMKAVYERFVKMYQVGVPIDAVKLKVKLEGLDPDGLDRYLHK